MHPGPARIESWQGAPDDVSHFATAWLAMLPVGTVQLGPTWHLPRLALRHSSTGALVKAARGVLGEDEWREVQAAFDQPRRLRSRAVAAMA